MCIIRLLYCYTHFAHVGSNDDDDDDGFPWWIILIIILLLILLVLLILLCLWCWRRKYVTYEAEKLGTSLLCTYSISKSSK